MIKGLSRVLMKLPNTGLIPSGATEIALARFLPFPNLIVKAIGILRRRQLIMQSSTNHILFLLLLSGSLMACATAAKLENSNGPEIFRVGEVEVRLYPDRERMVRNLPPLFALLEATKVGNTQIQVSGYFDPRTKTIHAINDARTVIHEFKHYLEPEWTHGHGPERSDKQSQPSTRLEPVGIPRSETIGANNGNFPGF